MKIFVNTITGKKIELEAESVSELKTLIANRVDLENNKNLIVVSVVLTVGVSGIIFLDAAFGGVALAMVLGVILNLMLRDKKEA